MRAPDFQKSEPRFSKLTGRAEFEIRARGLDRSSAPSRACSRRRAWRRTSCARLVLKELADNALDTGAHGQRRRAAQGGGYFVEDDGPGIDGTPEEIARLFSIARPMVSTKLLRLPTRGALGNGLRVVAGAVLASGGSLVVITRNRRIELRPERDGTTTVVSVKTVKHPVGTRIEISFGPALPCDGDALSWAQWSPSGWHGRDRPTPASPRRTGTTPRNSTSCSTPAASTPVRELIAQLDGCTGGKAGEIVAQRGLGRMLCKDVTRQQAAKLLEVAREQRQAGDAGAARRRRSGRLLRPRLRLRARQSSASARPSRRPRSPSWSRRGPKTTRRATRSLTVCVNRTPDHRRDRGRPRQARHRRLRLRALAHHRASTEGGAVRHLAQHHDAVHADHLRRQGTEPAAVPQARSATPSARR